MTYRYRKATSKAVFKPINEAMFIGTIEELSEALKNSVLDAIDEGEDKTIYTIGGFDIEAPTGERFYWIRNELYTILRYLQS